MHNRYDNFSHTYCTNNELAQLAIQVYAEIETNLLDDEFLTTERLIIKTECDTVDTLLGRSKSDEYTQKLDLSDQRRDKIIRVIKRNLLSDIDMAEFDPEMAEAAKTVQKLMGDNTVDIRAGYTAETAQINTLLSNSKASEYADAIQENPTTDRLFLALRNEQLAFEELLRKQAEASSQVPTGEVKKHIVEIVYRLEGILSYLERKAESHGGAYETTAATLEKIVEKIMTPAKARATRKENEAIEENAE
jgi:hypothetical protein